MTASGCGPSAQDRKACVTVAAGASNTSDYFAAYRDNQLSPADMARSLQEFIDATHEAVTKTHGEAHRKFALLELRLNELQATFNEDRRPSSEQAQRYNSAARSALQFCQKELS
jgi:hypothetical protein